MRVLTLALRALLLTAPAAAARQETREVGGTLPVQILVNAEGKAVRR